MKPLRRCLLLTWVCLLWAPGAEAQSGTSEPPDQPTVAEISEDELAVGTVRIHKTQRTLTFPAHIEIRDGELEYAVVHTTGKTHETLLATEVQPQQIHIAALLLDGEGQSPTISVSWETKKGRAEFALAELIQIVSVPADLLTSGPWTYNGSKFQDGLFAAQTEGSIIALMPDTLALVNHTASMKLDRDDVFRPKTSLLPPSQTVVEVKLRFPDID